MNDFDPDVVLRTITDLVTTWGLKVLGALVLLIIGRTVAKWARRQVRRALERSRMDETLVPFVASLTYYLLLAFVVIAVLGMVGIQTASIIAVLGAAGLAVGLALQGTLANFAAGVMLLIFRPFQKGDVVEVGGVKAKVDAVGIFMTNLTTFDNVAVTLPNSKVWGEKIENYSANDTRRNDMVVGIAYDDDIGTALDVVRRVVAADDRVLPEPEPTIAVGELGDSSVNILVRPWCHRDDYWALRWDLTRRLKEELEAAGCSIPFPQRDVHLFREDAA